MSLALHNSLSMLAVGEDVRIAVMLVPNGQDIPTPYRTT